jgi:hypothetical protein
MKSPQVDVNMAKGLRLPFLLASSAFDVPLARS